MLSEETERGWTGELHNGGFLLSRVVRGVKQTVELDAGLLASAEAAMHKRPQVQGQEQVQIGRELVGALQGAEKESLKRGDQFIASELFLLALADRSVGFRVKAMTGPEPPGNSASRMDRARSNCASNAAFNPKSARQRQGLTVVSI